MSSCLLFFVSFILSGTLIFSSTDADFFDPSLVGSSAAMIRKGYIEGFSPYSNTIFENPAGLYRVSRLSSSLFSTNIMDECQYYNFSASARLKKGVFGFGIMRLGVDNNAYTDISSNNRIFKTGNYYDFESFLFKLSYQYSLYDHMHVGFNLNRYQLSMGDLSGQGMNMDVGILIDLNRWEHSLVLKNMFFGKKVKFTDSEDILVTGSSNSSNGKTEDMPQSFVFSSLYYWLDFNFSTQFKYLPKDSIVTKHFAVEYTPRFFSFLTVSAGYGEYFNPDFIDGVFSESSVYDVFNYGVGFEMYGVNVDYAYELGDHVIASFKDRHYFSINFYF